MSEKLDLTSSNLPPGFRCPKCAAAGFGTIEAVGEASVESGDLHVSIEIRCPRCHAAIGEMKFECSAPADEYGSDD